MSGFQFTKNATVWWPVRWLEPVDGGGTREVEIELRFKRLTSEAAEAALKLPNAEFLAEVATGWRGISDEAGEPVPFTPEWQARWLAIPAVPAALGRDWMACVRAEPETRLGNSAGSASGGPAAAEPTAAPPATAKA